MQPLAFHTSRPLPQLLHTEASLPQPISLSRLLFFPHPPDIIPYFVPLQWLLHHVSALLSLQAAVCPGCDSVRSGCMPCLHKDFPACSGRWSGLIMGINHSNPVMHFRSRTQQRERTPKAVAVLMPPYFQQQDVSEKSKPPEWKKTTKKSDWKDKFLFTVLCFCHITLENFSVITENFSVIEPNKVFHNLVWKRMHGYQDFSQITQCGDKHCLFFPPRRNKELCMELITRQS